MKKNILKLFVIASLTTIYTNAGDLSRTSNGIVTDSSTNLQWQDDIILEKGWSGAIEYCENLTLGGYDDWRLPNINELLSIVDYNKADKYDNNRDLIKGDTFQKRNFFSSYISSTTLPYSKNSVMWYIDFTDGKVMLGLKNSSSCVRCVRGGQ